jgi:ankyrin repeat protein
LLLEHGADVNAAANDGMRPLHAAAQRGYVQVIRVLIAAGAEIDAPGPLGLTALHLAARSDEHTCRTLIASGANTSARSAAEGNTALHRACIAQNRGAIMTLAARGADLFARDRLGRSPMRLSSGIAFSTLQDVCCGGGAAYRHEALFSGILSQNG